MELSTLKTHIKNKTLDNFYIFTGPEVKVMDIYLEQMSKVANAPIKIMSCITEFAKKINSVSLVSNASICVLINDTDFISDYEKTSLILSNIKRSNCILVLRYTNIDKRSRLYKNQQDHIVDFQYMKPDILMKYIQKDIDLPDKLCETLISVCENDYSRILLEIDKRSRYASAKNITCSVAMEKLLKDGTIYVPPYDAVFDFVDAVLRNQKSRAFELLESSYACGESTLVLLSNLYNSAKQLLQVQSYTGSDKITDATGLTPFQVKLASGRKNINSNGDLVYLMRLVRNAEKGIKTGDVDEQIAVYYILVNYWWAY